MIARLFCILFLLSVGLRAAGAETLNEVTLAAPNARLTLLERGGRCFLTYVGTGAPTEIELAPEPPCAFFRNRRDAAPRVFAYPSFHADAVLLVGGGRLSAQEAVERDANRWIPVGETCINAVQGIVLDGETIHASRLILRGLSCPTLGRDEKDYWMIADDYAKTARRQLR